MRNVLFLDKRHVLESRADKGLYVSIDKLTSRNGNERPTRINNEYNSTCITLNLSKDFKCTLLDFK